MHLPSLGDGNYRIQIIGTGTGNYTFTARVENAVGSTTDTVFVASTIPNQTTTYKLTVSGDTQSITQDAIPPEASISFSTSTKKILISGTDDQSVPIISATSTSTVITDASGNTLAFNISKNIAQSNYVALVIPSFSYSSGTTTNATTSLRYFWTTDRAGKYTLFISAIKTPTDRQIAIYVPLLNKTYVVISTPNDDTDDLSLRTVLLLLRQKIKTYTGLYIPSIATQQGAIIVR
jgi:hypothetical protein